MQPEQRKPKLDAVSGVASPLGVMISQQDRETISMVREAIDAHRPAIAAETLAVSISVSHGAPFAGLLHDEAVLDGEPFALRLDRADSPT